jgi:O-antigen ligase
MAFGFLVLLSSLWSFNLNTSRYITLSTLLYLKEQVLYFVWFYMLVTLIRKPKDLRQFAMFFAIAGLMASFTGLAARLMGGAEAITPATMEQNLEEGAGGRAAGGWLGLGHPNMFAAMLLMTMPIWFFAISHLRHGIRRLMAEVAVITGFLGLLFTYSRSAWLGSAFGIGLVGLADRKALQRVVLFGLIFAIAAQTVVLFTLNTNLIEIVITRFEQLETSTFSSRPFIYASAMQVIRAYPLMGTGLGGFPAHAPATPMGWVPAHSHNVYLAYATEAGLPAAFLFIVLMVRILWMAVRNLRIMGQLPGYGFIALGSAAALIGLTAQTMAVQIFHHRILGFGFYGLVAIVVCIDRMIKAGQLDPEVIAAEEGDSAGSIWVKP